jgi:hypothetical protein
LRFSLTLAILLSAPLLIATGARGENTLRRVSGQPLPPGLLQTFVNAPNYKSAA